MNSQYAAILRSGEVRQLCQALDHGASAGARDASGTTALMHAAVYGDLSCLRLLIDRGAEVNATNAAGANALTRQQRIDARRPAVELASRGGAVVVPWGGRKCHKPIWRDGADGRSGGRR